MYGNYPYGGAPYGDSGSAGGNVVVRPAVLSVTPGVPAPSVRHGVRLGVAAQALALSLGPCVIRLVTRAGVLSLKVTLHAPSLVVPKSVEEARARPRLEPVWLVEVALKNSGPTLFFSDRNVTVGSQRYENYLEDLSGLGEELRRADSSALNAGLSLKFRNDRYRSYNYLVEIGETYPFEGAAVTIREVYLDDGGLPSGAATVFRGALDEPRDIDMSGFACRVSSAEYAMDRTWKQAIIDTDSWPNAYEDVGEAEPIIYGSGLTVPALRVDWGARTTLQAAITASSASLSLSVGSRFPAGNFNLWIDEEKIYVTTRTGNSCTGLVRGYGGTAAKAHRAGAGVAEAKAQYDSLLAGHELHSVGAVYAEIEGRLWRVVSGVAAVLSGGKHLLRATEHIRVKAVEDAIAVSDNIAVTVGGSTKNVYPDGLEPNPAPGTHDVSNSGHAYDGNENTACTLNPNKNTTGRLQLGFPDASYGAISTQYIHARLLGAITVGGGWTPSQVSPATAGWFRFSKAGGGWGDYVSFSNQNTGESPLVYEVYKEVEYSSSATKTGSAYRSGDIVATHSVERFHAVVSGAKDPDGNYGGLGSIIERPDRVIKHFLVEKLGYAHADIDGAGFDASGASYASAISGGYKFAFRIGERITPSDWLRRMARECRSTLKYRAGKWYLNYLPDAAPAAVKTISKGELAGQFVKFKFNRTSIEDLANDLTARFSRNYSRVGGDSEWNGTAKASDAASIAKYGTYAKDFDFGCLRLQAMADSVLAHMLKQRRAPLLTVELSVFWEHFGLAAGDTVDIDNPLFDARKFFIEGLRRVDRKTLAVRAVEWW